MTHSRTNKHDLKIRPIYHWKDRRIQAHLSICFMAFCCLQELRHRLRTRGIHHTLPELLASLENTRLVLVESSSQPDQRIVITQPLAKKVRGLLRAVGVPWPTHSFVIPKTSSGPQAKSVENSLFVVPQKTVQDGTATA